MMQTFDATTLLRARRDPLVEFTHYERKVAGFQEAYDLAQQSPYRDPASVTPSLLYPVSVSRQGRAWNAIDHLTLAYTAGHALQDLRDFYPMVLECWKDSAMWNEAYDASPESEGAFVAHLPLLGDGFDQANRLVCFAILLGYGGMLANLMPIVDYRNPRKDGLLERLIAPYVPGRGQPPDDCIRHLPYFKTLKIFGAAKEKRPAMIARYLDDWYRASRREPYYDSHKRRVHFYGYWSWESAAITFLLDIDDSSYRDALFYPRDLVDFARATGAPTSGNPPTTDAGELRAKAGQPCPQAGQWRSVDVAPQTRTYAAGETMANLNSAYGLTIWQYLMP